MRTDCTGKDGWKDPVKRLCRRPECGLDQCDSCGDVGSGQFLDVFKGRTIKPSPQIKCTEKKRGFEGDSKGLGLRHHNRDVPVWKGAGNPLTFLFLMARTSSYKCVSVDSVDRTKLRWSYLVTAGRD